MFSYANISDVRRVSNLIFIKHIIFDNYKKSVISFKLYQYYEEDPTFKMITNQYHLILTIVMA